MGTIEDAKQIGVAAGEAARKAGSTWAVALVVVILGGMFIADRLVMKDQYTRSEHDTWALQLTKETAAYRTRVDAAIEDLQQRTRTYDRDVAVTGETIKSINLQLSEIKATLKELSRR